MILLKRLRPLSHHLRGCSTDDYYHHHHRYYYYYHHHLGAHSGNNRPTSRAAVLVR